MRTFPRSGFRSGGTSAKTSLLETTLLSTPDFVALTLRVFPLVRNPAELDSVCEFGKSGGLRDAESCFGFKRA